MSRPNLSDIFYIIIAAASIFSACGSYCSDCCFDCCCCCCCRCALCCAGFSRFYDSLTPRFEQASLSSKAIETDFADAYVVPTLSCVPLLPSYAMKIIFRYVIFRRVWYWFTLISPGPLPPFRRHFRHHYLHGIECSSTLSNAPGRRSKNIKTQINSRQIRGRHPSTHTHTHANSQTCHTHVFISHIFSAHHNIAKTATFLLKMLLFTCQGMSGLKYQQPFLLLIRNKIIR